MKLIQELSPGYRTVFNMYVIEGYSRQEIAKQLNISEERLRVSWPCQVLTHGRDQQTFRALP